MASDDYDWTSLYHKMRPGHEYGVGQGGTPPMGTPAALDIGPPSGFDPKHPAWDEFRQFAGQAGLARTPRRGCS